MQDDEAEPRNLQAPETDDDRPTEPTLRPYMMSREFRGWIGGIAAALVAVAAVGPHLDVGPFGASAAIGLPEGLEFASTPSCTDEDQSGGTGGQHVGCSFTCPSGPGTLSVTVEADDNDAGVSGNASCGGADAHCSGRKTCSETSGRSDGGEASCSADSDEFWDSGLYVMCSAAADPLNKPPYDPPLGDEICPVHEPVDVCIQPLCGQIAAYLYEQCRSVWLAMKDLVGDGASTGGFWANGEEGTGIVCKGRNCVPAIPVCLPTGKGSVCGLA